ncbi:MAG: hypothetical protein BAJALOKI1v1_1260009 [Promethearchaeota archaeon]|nr:MAG: hypothetical protein BAJALOKI1v1_1260009 [Candidatus Lokiarchaeota archaeon]
MLRKILKHIGISEDRVQQYFCSAAEVENFVQSVEDISKIIHKLPPLPKKTEMNESYM